MKRFWKQINKLDKAQGILWRIYVNLCFYRVEPSKALTTFQSEKDKIERELRRDKWLLFPQKDIAELLASSQVIFIDSIYVIVVIYLSNTNLYIL